jgi:signal peptidase I
MARKRKNSSTSKGRSKKEDSLLETLESIVVAFVLAFIFRAFLVEAFVIPTGSMAPTLYGEHLEVRCRDCGQSFAVGIEEASDGMHTPPGYVVCPNCRLGQRPRNTANYSGDRILVLKFLYDFMPPERWDVIVFRNPNSPKQNYIKRLVGLPGEQIEIVEGNVTIDGEIVQKTDKAQEALWLPVHDTRRQATRREWMPRWVETGPGEGLWQRHEKGFRLTRPADERVAWLAYEHRNARGTLVPIGDHYGYNNGLPPGAGNRLRGVDAADVTPMAVRPRRWAVTDLAVRAPVTVGDEGGELVVELVAWNDGFRFELTARGSNRPSRILMNGEVIAKAVEGVLPVGREVELLAANVDHKVMLRVNGKRPLSLKATTGAMTPEGDPVFVPTDVSNGERERMVSARDPHWPAEVRIGARGGRVTLAYLRLERDVYYTGYDWDQRRWAHASERTGPLALQGDQFFVLGDNSPRSFDSRWWFEVDPPVVPRRNLVGRAFFMYWPAAGPRMRIPIAPDVTRFDFVH